MQRHWLPSSTLAVRYLALQLLIQETMVAVGDSLLPWIHSGLIADMTKRRKSSYNRRHRMVGTSVTSVIHVTIRKHLCGE